MLSGYYALFELSSLSPPRRLQDSDFPNWIASCYCGDLASILVCPVCTSETDLQDGWVCGRRFSVMTISIAHIAHKSQFRKDVVPLPTLSWCYFSHCARRSCVRLMSFLLCILTSRVCSGSLRHGLRAIRLSEAVSSRQGSERTNEPNGFRHGYTGACSCYECEPAHEVGFCVDTIADRATGSQWNAA